MPKKINREGDNDGIYGVMDKRSVEDVVGGREVVENYKRSRITLYNDRVTVGTTFKDVYASLRDYRESKNWN